MPNPGLHQFDSPFAVPVQNTSWIAMGGLQDKVIARVAIDLRERVSGPGQRIAANAFVSALSGEQQPNLNGTTHLFSPKKNLTDQLTGQSGFITWRSRRAMSVGKT